MAQPSDEYRIKLINKILFATSQEQVKGSIDEAIQAMEQNKVNKHLIARFTTRMINDLESFDPMNKEAQQWANIKSAKVLLNRVWNRLNTPSD